MSEKQFEPCTLEEATHFEIHGVMHELNDTVQYLFNGIRFGIRLRNEDTFIPEDAFPTLGIKPLRERKRKPIEFEFTFSGGMAFPLKAYGKTFLCVEIVEEKK